MHDETKQVGEFIIRLVIETFNKQFKEQRNWRDFTIVNIPPAGRMHCGFEISDYQNPQPVKFRIYSKFENENRVYPLTMCDDDGDSGVVYVAEAEFSATFLHMNNNYVRRSCPIFPPRDVQLGAILSEQGEPILGENNEPILAEA